MGTPDFAAVILKELAQWPRGEVVAVYTRPDKPAGRGHKLTPSPVKRVAQELDLPVLQPGSLKNVATQAELAALQPDVLVVAAYGLILPDAVLVAPRLAPLNVHASLLPRYRGAAPIQRAIMENRAEAREQDESCAGYAAKIGKEDGFIDWNRPAAQVHAHIRGVTPWPGARVIFAFAGEAEPLPLLLAPGRVGEPADGARPGELRHDADGLSVACADCWYRLLQVRPQGRKDMPVRDFINGRLRDLPEGICGRALPPV